MAQIECTQKLLKELKVKPESIQDDLSSLSSWHANLLMYDKRKCVLITNNKSLYSILMVGLTKPDFTHFDDVLGQNLFKNLLHENLPQEQIEMLLDEFREIHYTKTNNRSVLGSMNDMAFQLKVMIDMEEGLNHADIFELNHQNNRTIMSAIEEHYPIEAIKNMLNNAS